jgi:hypothetical protein
VIEQSAGPGAFFDNARDVIEATLRGALDSGWVLARPGVVFAPSSPAGALADRPATRSGASTRTAAPHRDATPKPPSLPLPQQVPTALGAAPSGASGGSLLIFAALLTPLLLTLPLLGRRQFPSAVRRLMGVVSRLERPG